MNSSDIYTPIFIHIITITDLSRIDNGTAKLMKECSKCHGFGKYQTYQYGRVMSKYCECPVGTEWLERLKKEFEARGMDITDPRYPWNRQQTS